jgi:hypothetical protein
VSAPTAPENPTSNVEQAIGEVLAAHERVTKVAEPRNIADHHLGRTHYEMRCTCGALMPWPSAETDIAHRAHVAEQVAAVVAGARAEAPVTCDHPGIEHGTWSYTWPCPSCGVCKFIGHGPLCGDCYERTDRETP